MEEVRDLKLRKKYRSMSCELCGSNELVSGHHIKTKGSFGVDHEKNLIALCFNHHQLVHCHTKNDFMKMYPSFEEILLSKGWEKIQVGTGKNTVYKWINEINF